MRGFHLKLIFRRLLRVWLFNLGVVLWAMLFVALARELSLLPVDFFWFGAAGLWALVNFIILFVFSIAFGARGLRYRRVLMVLYWVMTVVFVAFVYLSLQRFPELAFLVVVPLSMRGVQYYRTRDVLWAYAALFFLSLSFKLLLTGSGLPYDRVGFWLSHGLVVLLLTYFLLNLRRLKRVGDRQQELFRRSSQDSSRLRKTNQLLSDAYEKLAYRSAEMERMNQLLSSAYDELSQRNATMERDLTLASQIQKHLIPEELPQPDSVRFEARFLPFDKVGGDLYFVRRMEDSVWLFMTDVSGHGMPAALVAAMCHGSVNHYLAVDKSPEQILNYMNRELAPFLTGFYFTAFLARLDLSSLTLHYAIAGHPFPVLSRSDGELEVIEGDNPILGIFTDIEVVGHSRVLAPGDRLFIFTDALYESRSIKGEMLGYDRLVHWFAQKRTLALTELADGVLAYVREFAQGRELEDDFTFVALEAKSST